MPPFYNRLLRRAAPVLTAGVSAIGLAVTGGSGIAGAAVHASAATPRAVAPVVRSVTLVTGDRVTVSTVNGHNVYSTVSPSGHGVTAEHYQSASGDYYLVPAEVTPYLGHGLDPSLFDVSALLRDRLTTGSRIPVSLSFGSGVTPSAPPGVTLTSASAGYLTDASSAGFAAGLRKTIGADVRAGHPAGTTALFGGLSSMGLAAQGVATPPKVTPHYVLHTLQINATDLAGKPADGLAILFNTDSVLKENTDVSVDAGIGRVQVPAGHYASEMFFTDFDGQGNPTALRMVIRNDLAVPDTSGVTTTEKVSESAASAKIAVTTPRPSTVASLAVDWFRADPAGKTVDSGFVLFADDPFQTMYASPQPAAKVGASHFLVQWQGAGPSTGPRYQYSVAFGTSGIPANETHKVRKGQLATVHAALYNDPANKGLNSALLDGATDSFTMAAGGYSDFGVPQQPGAVTQYLGTGDGGQWAQEYFGPGQNDGALMAYAADPVTFTAGRDYRTEWAHGPLAPSYGQHSGWSNCAACVAGSTLGIGYQSIASDSDPSHTQDMGPGGSVHFTLDQNGKQVFDQDGRTGTDLTGIPATPSTYREVLDTDLSGVPGVSQSTKTHTDLTFRYDPAHPGAALPAGDFCDGMSAKTPCRIQPVLSLSYHLATDLTNTSHLSAQKMALNVGHLSYDGKGSHAAITGASVLVSFDGGKTWRHATLTGHHGAYTASWSNPASADGTKPELKVTAKDAAGGSITQTVTDAYSIAASTH